MNRPAEAPVTECCNHRNRHIDITTSDAQLTCVYCPGCERRQWFKDGQPVALTDITDSAAREWNRRLSPR